jgi:hypothetical protein
MATKPKSSTIFVEKIHVADLRESPTAVVCYPTASRALALAILKRISVVVVRHGFLQLHHRKGGGGEYMKIKTHVRGGPKARS